MTRDRGFARALYDVLSTDADSDVEPFFPAQSQAISEAERRKAYLEGLKADYAALRADAKASKNCDKEMALWDRTTADGPEDL